MVGGDPLILVAWDEGLIWASANHPNENNNKDYPHKHDFEMDTGYLPVVLILDLFIYTLMEITLLGI